MRARLSALADDLEIVAVHLLLPDDLRAGLPAIDRGWVGFDSEADPSMTGITSRGSREKLLGKVIERLRADDAALDFATVAAPLERASTRLPLVFMHFDAAARPVAVPARRPRLPHQSQGLSRVRAWPLDRPPVAGRPELSAPRAAGAVRRNAVGGLLDKLREAGLYDRAVILLTADHGVSFCAGQPRRRLTKETMPDLVLVPFFVKVARPALRPGRRPRGAVGRRSTHARQGGASARAVAHGRDARRRTPGRPQHANRRDGPG